MFDLSLIHLHKTWLQNHALSKVLKTPNHGLPPTDVGAETKYNPSGSKPTQTSPITMFHEMTFGTKPKHKGH